MLIPVIWPRVPGLYNVCELDLMIYCFPEDLRFLYYSFCKNKKHNNNNNNNKKLISGDYSFAVFQVDRTLNNFLNGGSIYKWSTNFMWIRMTSLLEEGKRVGPVFFFVINKKHSFLNCLLLNLTLC